MRCVCLTWRENRNEEKSKMLLFGHKLPLQSTAHVQWCAFRVSDNGFGFFLWVNLSNPLMRIQMQFLCETMWNANCRFHQIQIPTNWQFHYDHSQYVSFDNTNADFLFFRHWQICIVFIPYVWATEKWQRQCTFLPQTIVKDRKLPIVNEDRSIVLQL